jgi:hypothetical protein
MFASAARQLVWTYESWRLVRLSWTVRTKTMTRREPRETVCRMRSLNQGTEGSTSCGGRFGCVRAGEVELDCADQDDDEERAERDGVQDAVLEPRHGGEHQLWGKGWVCEGW